MNMTHVAIGIISPIIALALGAINRLGRERILRGLKESTLIVVIIYILSAITMAMALADMVSIYWYCLLGIDLTLGGILSRRNMIAEKRKITRSQVLRFIGLGLICFIVVNLVMIATPFFVI
jgi:hypothetical protein